MKKLITIIALGLILTGCTQEANSDKINVTATTTMITDLVQQIGGDRVEVYAMMQAGVDPHSYKARPSDVLAIDRADIVAYNGINLEAKLVDVFDSLSDRNKVLMKLEDGLDKADLLKVDGDDIYDPHIWFNVDLWRDSANYITLKLSEYEPESKAMFETNRDAYLKELDLLEDYIITQLSLIPQDQRILVTAHDAFAYFGSAYGIEVESIQGINSQSEAGIRDINNLSKKIIERNIRSVYSESSVPIKTIEALVSSVQSKGHPLEIGGELYSDSLREHSTYIETFKANIDTIVEGLK